MLCKYCHAGKCSDLGTESEPISLECSQCNGAGCEHCNDGHVDIVGCPQRECSSIVDAVEMIDLFRKGLPPVSGGTLDQSVWFLDAARILENEESKLKAEKYGN
jgi:hypothetical protein